ncbi:hypothetical protein M5225_000265 [Vibrio vulnificus]|uniref:hypothetical protein n=1 Tax=Vibrio vulnificus TaxID=672 RepID=UPI001A2800DC|nr:hypothetical protein [Vibrio vulnificus]EHH1180605.1 hypothetical protein [Vibrio vulnificus]EHH1188652.1 hypothetical protein [Vibrio vulnificus]EHU4846325.1 hypothetical protein [Vibrio vulnificus]EHZ2900088.1 hypothetical protein [Vibrio vulnificus]EIA1302919.1 hypothetical protein [Vibrio vulnificus]
MSNLTRLAATTFMSASIIACGGGGGGSSSDTSTTSDSQTTLQGTAIDGYIDGAHVYLDINYNGDWDVGEPNFFTDEDGKWSMLIDGRFGGCEDYVPVVIDVPLGAVDSDYGEVTEAYQMTYPPKFAVATDEEIMNTTPLTTVVWDTIQNELHAGGETLTCNKVKDNYELRERIKARVQEQEFRVAQRYNVTVDELYGDYIAEGNRDLHAKAAALVPSMQASYADTVTIEAAYPNADLVWVEYFKGDWDERGHYAAGWYKETYINQGDTSGWSSVTESVSDDLETINETVGFYKGTKRNVNGLTYEWTNTFINNTELTTCRASEWIEQDADTGFGVKNVFELSLSTASACENVNWANHTDTVKQQLTTRVQSCNDNTTSQHFFDSVTDTGLGHLVMVNPENIAASELDAVNFISTDFNNNDAYGATYWSRIESVMNPSADIAQRVTSHSETGTWVRTITYTNGTYSEQCSSDSGITWSAKVGDTCEK